MKRTLVHVRVASRAYFQKKISPLRMVCTHMLIAGIYAGVRVYNFVNQTIQATEIVLPLELQRLVEKRKREQKEGVIRRLLSSHRLFCRLVYEKKKILEITSAIVNFPYRKR